MSPSNRHPIKKRMAGVGMLEILIALLVVAIGVLGLAQLQGIATRQNHNAYLRSQATVLAYSVIDAVRANRQNAANYALADCDSPPSGTSRADIDLATWCTAVTSLLPGGDGSIVDNGNTFTVTVEFDDSRGEEVPVEVITETEP